LRGRQNVYANPNRIVLTQFLFQPSWDGTTVEVPDGLAVGSLLPAGLGEMLEGWDGTHVRVLDGIAVG
jgi:hypothetical protein